MDTPLYEMVSIPFISGHIVILWLNLMELIWVCFNPLYIGSYCNKSKTKHGTKVCFNPLYIGSYCNLIGKRQLTFPMVSIPFISGHIVIQQYTHQVMQDCCFNPLYIGSYCNKVIAEAIEDARVSIPFISGHIVIKNNNPTISWVMFQSPLYRVIL